MKCQACGHQLADGEPVHRILVSGETIWPHRFGGGVGHICAKCASEVYFSHKRWRDPVPCSNCAYPVKTDTSREPTQSVTCGPECQRLAYNARARQRREWRRTALTCETCGDQFRPKRTDARYCSSACRQKAYRRRSAGRAPVKSELAGLARAGESAGTAERATTADAGVSKA